MVRNMLRYLSRAVEVLFILLLLWCYFNSDLLLYGIAQGIGQMKIVIRARPVREVLSDPAAGDRIKSKLLYIEEVKRFAIDSLGLKSSKNYTTLYDQHGKPILWVLTASEKFQLKPYEWKFPVIGSVGYKGFFDFNKGKKEKEQLDALGYDTDYGPVSAWSTLGWFHDPILSGMLRRNEGALAELIIHEMTHATLYILNDVDFNENLASFVGEEGAILFLQYKFGKIDSSMSPPYIPAPLLNYLQEKEDYDSYTAHFLKGTASLDSLYHSFTNQLPGQEKLALKRKMISDIVTSLDTLKFHHPEKYLQRFTHEQMPNNTYFLSFTRYDAQKDDMKKEMNEKFHGDFRNYLLSLKAK